ncbi:MAG: class I SAM-dependent methyltransferase [Blastocatellia bacterium]|nr:class I SAM-dependent methyltransferase [Blastocatellia bacterium]
MVARLSLTDIVRGMRDPMSTTHAIDPFAIKAYPKHSLLRMAWTAQSRLRELQARRGHRLVGDWINPSTGVEIIHDRGAELAETAVTSGQMALLKRALAAVRNVAGDVVEVGCYRGVTTAELAAATSKTVFAVDPFIGYGGSEREFILFKQRVSGIPTIRHVRATSGEAARTFDAGSLSFAFIDAVHDVSNSWFDFAAWSPKIARNGLVAMHDVDDHPGVGYTLKRILRGDLPYQLWGYCPNLAVLRKS